MSLAIWSLAEKMFHCTFWSLAAQNVPLFLLVPGGTKYFIIPFGPWRDKMFHCTFWSLAAQNVSLYPLVPGGSNAINMRPLQGRFSQYPDPSGVTCLYTTQIFI